MADLQVGNIHEVAAVSIGDSDTPTNINGTNVSGAGFFDADAVTIDALKARLTAIDGTLYTAAHLATLTMNDMLYAVRLADSPGTIR